MKNVLLFILISAIQIVLIAAPKNLSGSGISFGRYIKDAGSEDSKTFMFSLTCGFITDFEGSIEETKRAGSEFYEDREEYEKYLESYTFDDLGFDDNYMLYGFQLEKQWKFLTLLLDLSYFNAKADSVAANEPYALGLEEVIYNGRGYEYMLIEQGQPFSTEIDGGIINLRALVTPFNFLLADKVHFSPWLHLGIYSFGGKFEIDAGEAEGITHYEYYDYDYVINGQGEGWFGVGIPEYGFGGELVFDLFTLDNKDVNLSVQFNIVSMDWEGSTKDFGLNVRHDKNIDLEYNNRELKVALEFPVFKNSDLILGLKIQTMDAFAKVEAIERTEEEADLFKEKYDKDVDIKVTTTSVFAALKF